MLSSEGSASLVSIREGKNTGKTQHVCAFVIPVAIIDNGCHEVVAIYFCIAPFQGFPVLFTHIKNSLPIEILEPISKRYCHGDYFFAEDRRPQTGNTDRDISLSRGTGVWHWHRHPVRLRGHYLYRRLPVFGRPIDIYAMSYAFLARLDTRLSSSASSISILAGLIYIPVLMLVSGSP